MEITFWKLSIYIIIMNYFWCEICLFCPIFYLFIQSSMLLWTHWIFKIWFKLSDSSVYLFYCSLFFFPAMSTRCALIWLLCPSGICESVCVCVCVCVCPCVCVSTYVFSSSTKCFSISYTFPVSDWESAIF